jgi:hypothetical protein
MEFVSDRTLDELFVEIGDQSRRTPGLISSAPNTLDNRGFALLVSNSLAVLLDSRRCLHETESAAEQPHNFIVYRIDASANFAHRSALLGFDHVGALAADAPTASNPNAIATSVSERVNGAA